MVAIKALLDRGSPRPPFPGTHEISRQTMRQSANSGAITGFIEHLIRGGLCAVNSRHRVSQSVFLSAAHFDSAAVLSCRSFRA
jgi:hypothetical protein